jgi:hypothetical protein
MILMLYVGKIMFSIGVRGVVVSDFIGTVTAFAWKCQVRL